MVVQNGNDVYVETVVCCQFRFLNVNVLSDVATIGNTSKVKFILSSATSRLVIDGVDQS